MVQTSSAITIRTKRATIVISRFRITISMEVEKNMLSLRNKEQTKIYMCMTARVVYLAMVTSRMLRDSVVLTSQDMALRVQL